MESLYCAQPEGLRKTCSRHVFRLRFAQIAHFVRAQNCLSAILSNKVSEPIRLRHPSPCEKSCLLSLPCKAKDGGAGGIRTLDTALQPYNGLANRRLQPLGHSSIQNFNL
jgi:hypothetical protein